jgi:pimeloyl-ACP methyl ester carboxylesterase
VQPAIGQVTRACAYDRAGYGFSDPATAPSDVTMTISDLHALLHSKAVTTPVVLVGHSLGGLYAASYALRYPRDVAAMVLVEPAFSGQANQIARAVGPAAAGRMEAANKQTIASLDRCIALAGAGRLSLPAEQASDCLDNPPDPDAEVHRERNREAKSVAFERALRSEYEMANITGADGQTQDDRQTGWSRATLGAMPLVVLTRGDSEALSGLSTDEIAKAELAWRTGHDRLAALSTVGTNTIVPNSRHFVQLDQPEVVTKQVLRILSLVRR